MSTTLNWMATAQATVPGELSELVRGNEQTLYDRMHPLVCEHDVVLNLENVSRIDAAGVSTLIKLYCAAHHAGHSFTIENPAPHVAEILVLLGLDRILMSHTVNSLSTSGLRFEKTAA